MANTRDIEGLQQQTDVEQARQKLQEVAETKEGRKDPRSAETALTRTSTDIRVPDDRRDIPAGKVPPNKKKFGQKLKEAMFSEDIGNGSVSEHIFFKIIVPSFKKVIYEGLNTALCMVLNMDPKTNKLIGGNTHTANASLYRTRAYDHAGGGYTQRSPIADCEWDEATAKDYFNDMLEVVEKYGDLSITNVYSICCLENRIRTTDRNWGWTKAMMQRADVYCIDNRGERWVIDLPDPRPLR